MAEPYRILVTGSRAWDNEGLLAFRLGEAVGEALKSHRQPVIVHGACPVGADHMADQLARDHGLPVERHPADWTLGKSAGFRRNTEMAALGADVCLAFIRNGSRGATHCAALAKKAGIPVRRYTADGGD